MLLVFLAGYVMGRWLNNQPRVITVRDVNGGYEASIDDEVVSSPTYRWELDKGILYDKFTIGVTVLRYPSIKINSTDDHK